MMQDIYALFTEIGDTKEEVIEMLFKSLKKEGYIQYLLTQIICDFQTLYIPLRCQKQNSINDKNK